MRYLNIFNNVLSTILFVFTLQCSIAYAYSDKNKAVEWLFVITSKEADIKKNAVGEYLLSLNHAKIERVLAFSDRPNRFVKFISPEKFKTLWIKSGKRSFSEDPPNAVAVFGQEKIAIQLTSIIVDKYKTVFTVKSDDDKLSVTSLADLSLFIDGHLCPRSCVPAKTYCAAAKNEPSCQCCCHTPSAVGC